MTDKKKPNAKPVNRKAAPAKPPAKRKPAPKKIEPSGEWPAFGDQPSIKLVNPVGKEFGATKRKPAVKKIKDTPIQLAENFDIKDLLKRIDPTPLAEIAPAFMQATVLSAADVDGAYCDGYKTGTRAVRLSDALFAFAAGGSAIALVSITLRHYGVF